MTNKSFLFRTGDHHCICRIPGPGTELLINREQEKEVYDAIRPLGITEHVLYLNPSNGYKISEYYENTRNASADNWDEYEGLAWIWCAGFMKQACKWGIALISENGSAFTRSFVWNMAVFPLRITARSVNG